MMSGFLSNYFTNTQHAHERALSFKFLFSTRHSAFSVSAPHLLPAQPDPPPPPSLSLYKMGVSTLASLHPQLQPRQSDPQKHTQHVSICMRRMCRYFNFKHFVGIIVVNLSLFQGDIHRVVER